MRRPDLLIAVASPELVFSFVHLQFMWVWTPKHWNCLTYWFKCKFSKVIVVWCNTECKSCILIIVVMMWWAAAAIYLERESTCIKPLESERLIFWLFNYTNEVRNMIDTPLCGVNRDILISFLISVLIKQC